MKKRNRKDNDRIDKAYRQTCGGISINVMDIGKVFEEGQRLIDSGATDEGLSTGIQAFVQTIRQN